MLQISRSFGENRKDKVANNRVERTNAQLHIMNSRSNGEINNMDVNRKVVKQLKLNEDIDDGYVQMDRAELISIMWEITQDAWSFMRDQNAEQRLQRDVAIVTGRTS